MNPLESAPSAQHFPAGARAGVNRGGSHPPHSAEQGRSPKGSGGSGRRKKEYFGSRVLTIRLNPDKETWRLLRQRASEAQSYINKHIQARVAVALGWRVPEERESTRTVHRGKRKGETVGNTLIEDTRARERGMLSSNVYVGCEALADGLLKRKVNGVSTMKAVMAGAAMPQARQNDSLCIATISGRAGVEFRDDGRGGLLARLHVSAKEHGGWLTMPVMVQTKVDAYRWPLLLEMASGKVGITNARVIFRPMSGKTLLRLSYDVGPDGSPLRVGEPVRPAPSPGEHAATLSQLENGRILLRSERATKDFTDQLIALRQRKADWDKRRREIMATTGNGNPGTGRHGRRKRKKLLARENFDDWQSTYLHTWSRRIVQWCASQGVGHLTVLLTGGDWNASGLIEKLRYKAQECGIELKQADLADESTERAAQGQLRKRRRRAQKLGDALREVSHQLTGDNT